MGAVPLPSMPPDGSSPNGQVSREEPTLRDVFAMTALKTMVVTVHGDRNASRLTAEWAYEIADAMLVARARPRGDG